MGEYLHDVGSFSGCSWMPGARGPAEISRCLLHWGAFSTTHPLHRFSSWGTISLLLSIVRRYRGKSQDSSDSTVTFVGSEGEKKSPQSPACVILSSFKVCVLGLRLFSYLGLVVVELGHWFHLGFVRLAGWWDGGILWLVSYLASLPRSINSDLIVHRLYIQFEET